MKAYRMLCPSAANHPIAHLQKIRMLFPTLFRSRAEQKNLYLPYSTTIRLRTIAAKEQKAWQR
jgi:hypothetical protein